MIRTDFVSNSSSCSFVVYIETKEDLEEFAKIYDKVKELTHDNIIIYPLLEYACKGYEPSVKVKFLEMIEIGDCINVSSGDDHYGDFENKFKKLLDLFTKDYKFKIYKDYEAHMTYGEDYRDPKQKQEESNGQ